MLYAVIDIGSNTVRMAIYDIEGDRVEMVMRKKHMVGLASYVRNGVMMQGGIDKAVEILAGFKEFINSFGIREYTAFTTAAIRNSRNCRDAVRQIEERTGMAVRVLSGDEEATYDFIGATRDLVDDKGLLIDIGGGSTEIVYFKDREIVRKVSLPIGSLAFHTKYSEGILPSETECADMRAEAEATIGAAKEFQAVYHAQICGIGGTFKGAMALYNSMYGMRSRNNRMETRRIPDILRRFTRDSILTQQDTILLMRTVPDRMRTFMPGLIIADVLAKRFESGYIIYSDSGVREGFIYSEILEDEDGSR